MINKKTVNFILLSILVFITNVYFVNAQSITFNFEPPDNYKEIQTTDTLIELFFDGEKKITDTNTSKTEITYQKTDNGYKMINKLISVDAKRNGNMVNSPVNNVLVGKQVSFILDKEGKLLSIDGYDSILKEIKEVVSPKTNEAFAKLLDPEVLRKKTATEWDGRIGDFTGKNVKKGEKWASVYEYKLKNETLKYLVTTEFTEVSNDMVKINFSYTTDKKSVASILKELNKDIVKNINIADFEGNNSSLSGSGYRIMNPKTMLVKEEQVLRSIDTVIKTNDGVEHKTKRTEKRDYKFEKAK